jgi:hypothetical protein
MPIFKDRLNYLELLPKKGLNLTLNVTDVNFLNRLAEVTQPKITHIVNRHSGTPLKEFLKIEAIGDVKSVLRIYSKDEIKFDFVYTCTGSSISTLELVLSQLLPLIKQKSVISLNCSKNLDSLLTIFKFCFKNGFYPIGYSFNPKGMFSDIILKKY